LPSKGGGVVKIESKQVSFLPVAPWPGRRRFRFYGNANSMQLLETALVFEGYRKTLGFPVIDILVQWAMCEWTTVTVPYSRIARCRYSRRWVARSVIFAFFILPMIVMIGLSMALILNGRDSVAAISMDMLLTALIAVEIWIMFHFFPSCYTLVFQLADGRRGLTRFRIKSKTIRRSFDERLESNRKAALAA
jgi:hypothetical protein